MKRVAVIGAGAMGSGIAQVAAMAGHEVIVYDAWADAVVKGRDGILRSLNKLAGKGKLTDQEAKAIFARIYFVDHLESIEGCDLVIEAIIEDETIKRDLYSRIEPILAPDTVIATNTSSLSVTSLANGLQHQERCIGIHFFNPPVMMKLVEIIPALQTAPQVTSTTMDIISSWGKHPVLAKDTPGFIVNRIARPFYSEALRMAEEQIAPIEVIDLAMRQKGGFKMGPFELMDFIGHDVNEAVTRSVWAACFYEPRYKPSQLQVNLVRAGWLGRKSGRGFYKYPETEESSRVIDEDVSVYICNRLVTMLVHEAADALYYGIATKEDIDIAMTLGVNYPKGLLQWADEIGIAECVRRMDELYSIYHEDRYRGSALLRRMADNQENFYR